MTSRLLYVKKGSPYSITECRVPELIPVLCSQPAGDEVINLAVGCHYFPPDQQLPPQPLRAATNFAAWWTEAWWVWTVCLRLLPDSAAAAIWTQAFRAWTYLHLHLSRDFVRDQDFPVEELTCNAETCLVSIKEIQTEASMTTYLLGPDKCLLRFNIKLTRRHYHLW